MTRGNARRGTLREHGEPDRGVYFGRNPKRPTGDGVLVRIAREARAIRLRDTAGNTVAAFGDTTKFWLAAAPSQLAWAAGPAGQAATSPSIPAARTCPPRPTPISATPLATARDGLSAAVTVADQRLAARAAELAISYRLTAEAIAAAGTVPVPIRQTWHAAGNPEAFLYYERDVRPGRPILATTTDGYRIHDARTGQLIAHYASPVPMWIAAAPAEVAPVPVIDGARCVDDSWPDDSQHSSQQAQPTSTRSSTARTARHRQDRPRQRDNARAGRP